MFSAYLVREMFLCGQALCDFCICEVIILGAAHEDSTGIERTADGRCYVFVCGSQSVLWTCPSLLGLL